MYRVATFLLREWWGQHDKMTDALTVLLLTWNGAFYRYGLFSANKLEACLKEQWNAIEAFHHRDIIDFTAADENLVRDLFSAMLKALAIADGKSRGRQTPVGVAKTLHLLAPAFFPLWDQAIAEAYDCRYGDDPTSAYLEFCRKILSIARKLGKVPAPDRTLLKCIDEYNYARYTQGWV